MKYFNLRFALYFIKIFFVGLIALCVLSNGYAQSQEKAKKKKKAELFNVDFGVGIIYDDNILKYSEKYLERFLSGQDFGRFHIETYDDIIIKPSLKLASSFNIFKKLKSRVNIDYSYSAYVVNNVKNWNSIGIGFQQSLPRRTTLKVSYIYIPEFYVRHFRDEDLVYVYGYVPETFVPFSFSKDDFGVWIQKSIFKNTRLKLAFNYAKYYHNEHYTEYDCDNLTYGIQINQPITKKVKLEAGFDYTTSDAKGYDSSDKEGLYAPDETMENSNDADATNREESYFLGGAWQIPDVLKHKNSLDATIGYERRNYTTEDNPIEDPEHAGRLDENLTFAFNYDFELNKNFSLSVFYRFYGRNSSTSSIINSNYVSNEKDYKQNQVGLTISYGLKF
jgi:hypothetical protein